MERTFISIVNFYHCVGGRAIRNSWKVGQIYLVIVL